MTATTDSQLADGPARDHIATDLNDTLFVEAGAGSGKTSSLVDRIVNLVADGGVPVTRIAAITFTEAAARELRTRVRDAMIEQAVSGAGDVESAAFTTLHGFALRLLSDHAIESELPPGFGVVDEITSALDFERDWRLFVGQIGDNLDLLELQERAAALDIKIEPFASVAKSFDDNWDLLARFDELVTGRLPPLSPVDCGSLLESLLALDELTPSCISTEDQACQAIAGLVGLARQLLTEDPLLQVQGLKNLKWPRKIVGRKTNWRDPGIEHVRGRISAVRADVETQLDLLRQEVIEQFKTLVAKHVLDRVRSRQRAGQLSFHDLLVLARRLLRSDETVRQALHQRYTRILLDEFQDTDPIQIELAVLLAHPGPVGDRRWQDLAAEVPPGRLVVVGDPKQAIYRFRRADIGVYAETESVLAGDTTRLVTNFRSVPGVVAWVNEMFGRAIGEGQPGAQPPYTPLAANRDPHPGVEIPVVVLGGEHDREHGVGEVREMEAADVAAVVCRIMEDEWPVLHHVDGMATWRPAQLKDIAVLIPSRLSLPALESAFTAANVPFRPETNSLVYATQEVRDVVAGVRAVVDPTSSIDVVAALRSTLFAVSDHDLLAWKLAEGSWDYRRSGPDDMSESAVALAFEQLRRWHGDRWWSDAAGLVDRIVRERRLRELALADSRPRDRWRRYRFLAEQARLFSEAQAGDLQDFVEWVEIQASDLARVTEPVPPEPDDDAVRVLTIHGAKGLEFPVAILAGAPSQEGKRRPGPQVLFTPDGRPEVKLAKDKRTSGYDVRASVEEILDHHERIRLHYVGATRARDHLVVSAHHKAGLASLGRRTWEIIQERPDLWRPFERRGDERYDVRPATQLRLAGGGYDHDRDEWLREQEVILDQAAASRTWSATKVAEALSPVIDLTIGRPGEPVESEPLVDATAGNGTDLVDVEPANGAGSLLGSLVHDVLQQVPLDAGRPEVDLLTEADTLVQAVAAHGGLEHLVHSGRKRVGSALRSATFASARSNPAWRELYLGVPTETGILEGYVDLCIDGPDGLIIVDYKTDRVEEGQLDDFVARYRPQLAAYAVMAEAVVGRPVMESRLLLLRDSEALELPVPDLGQAMADVRQLVRLT